jgi:thiosulfate dehydrogenase [quinone] large subunit
MPHEDSQEFAKRMVQKYNLNVKPDVAASAYTSKPKFSPLFARTSFRSGGNAKTEHLRVQRERRNLLRNILGLTVVSVPFLLWLKTAYFTTQAQTPEYVTNTATSSNLPNPSTGGSAPSGGSLLTNAASVPVDQSLTYNDPNFGPFVLIHLDNGEFVAYSSICTHAGCQVQFDPSSKDLICPCHGAVYDPSNGAQVIAGPAPYPLQKIPIQYNPSTGNIYLTG